MKKITSVLLSVVFVVLIVGSVKSTNADHTEFQGQGIFTNQGDANIIESWKSKYQVNLQVILRTGDGQLINVTESTSQAALINHKITDDIFDKLMGEKEIITVDGIKYEKVQYKYDPSLEFRYLGLYPIFSEIRFEFKENAADIAKMNTMTKEYSIWKIHYCATFEGHGYTCIPVFQVLVPTMTLNATDVVSHQWTILRQMN